MIKILLDQTTNKPTAGKKPMPKEENGRGKVDEIRESEAPCMTPKWSLTIFLVVVTLLEAMISPKNAMDVKTLEILAFLCILRL